MKRKLITGDDYREVVYDNKHWANLANLREQAMKLMEALERSNLESIVHGSIARGDTSKKSDVDVFLEKSVSSFSLETALEKAGIAPQRRLIVQATPTYAMKAHVEIAENVSVTFPLMKMRRVEREFYRFGGKIGLQDIRKGVRVEGVDKRLILIEPTEEGHRESTVLGRETQAARILNVSLETVMDRVHALARRDKIGRTGVFVEEELRNGETFEMALKRVADKNPAVRRRARTA